MPSGRVFVDANVLVHAHEASDTAKRAIAVAILNDLWHTGAGVVSTQVLADFYAATTRGSPAMKRRAAREIVVLYGQWPVVAIDVPMIVAASWLEETHGLSLRDALLVEAARRAGASRLLTEALQHGRRFGALRVENPFR